MGWKQARGTSQTSLVGSEEEQRSEVRGRDKREVEMGMVALKDRCVASVGTPPGTPVNGLAL